jgi:hypothetical protein
MRKSQLVAVFGISGAARRGALWSLAVLWLVMAVGVVPTWGQTANTGAINGTIHDRSGAVVPGAQVHVVNEATGDVYDFNSTQDGTYVAPLLQSGTYRVEVSKDGFKTFIQSGIRVVVTETKTADIVLDLGAISEKVEVRADAEILQTESAALGHVTDQQLLEGLPLVTRNYTQILGLSPGVASDVNNAAALGTGTDTFSAHGSQISDNNFQMNGLGVNDLFLGEFVPIPNPDTIQEFKVQTGQYDASFGRNSGANVNVVTKGGGNEFHGSVFEFFRNNDLDANDFFLNEEGQPRGVLKQNQFGADVGGRIIRDKLFFFTSYQGTRQQNGLDSTCLGNFVTPPEITNSASSRTQAALGAEFANQPGAFGETVDPTGANIVPQAVALLNTKLANGGYLIPAPANATGTTVVSQACTFNEDQFMTNADYVQSERSKWSGRFFWTDNAQVQNFSTNAGTGGGNVPGFPNDTDFRYRDFSLSNSFVISPTLVNQIVIGFSRTVRLGLPQEPSVTVNGGSAAPITLGALGYSPVPANDNVAPSIAVLGNFAMGGNGQGFDIFMNNYEFNDTLSWVHGRHSFHFGGGLSHQEINFEHFTFPGLIVYASMPDFLTGNPILVADLQGLVDRAWRTNNGSAYAQDNIQVTKNLTVYAGLRYEFDGVIGEAHGESSNYNPNLLNPNPPAGGTLQGVQVSSNFKGTLPSGVTRAKTSAAINGDGQNEFAPRVGYAYKLPWSNRFLLRGGYGLFFSRSTGQLFLQLIAVPPFSDFRVAEPPLGVTNAAPFLPVPTFPNFAPLAYSPTTAQAPQIFSPQYQPSRTQEYSTSLQTELAKDLVLEVGYDGVRGTKLAQERAFNQALDATVTPIRGRTVNTLANLSQRVPFEGFSTDAIELETAGSQWYNALDVSLNKRFSHGLELLAAYTWARSLTDASGYAQGIAQGANLIGNQNDPHARWGPDGFVRPQRLVLSYLYNIPGPTNHFSTAGRFLAGWGISGVTTIQSGDRLTLTIEDANNAFGITGAGLNGLPAEIAPGCTAGQLATSGSIESRLNHYFNAACITSPPIIGAPEPPPLANPTLCGAAPTCRQATAFGNAGPGLVAGPNQVNFDFAVLKRTPIGSNEARNLEFRAEFFNLFNHPQFMDPTTLVQSPAFGVIGSTVASARIIQFALKFNF